MMTEPHDSHIRDYYLWRERKAAETRYYRALCRGVWSDRHEWSGLT